MRPLIQARYAGTVWPRKPFPVSAASVHGTGDATIAAATTAVTSAPARSGSAMRDAPRSSCIVERASHNRVPLARRAQTIVQVRQRTASGRNVDSR